MRNGFLWSLIVCWCGTSLALAQPVPALDSGMMISSPSITSVVDGAAPSAETAACTDDRGRVWVSADYLLWRIKKGPQADPLATTSTASGLNPGDAALGSLGTSVAIGGRGLSYGPISGARLTAGAWLDADRTLGLEGSGFFLARKSLQTRVSSDANGNPLIAVPFFDVTTGLEGAAFYSLPGFLNGAIAVSSTTQLWGFEVNGPLNLFRSSLLDADLLIGFRHMNLRERLTIAGSVTPNGPGLADVGFAGGFVGFPTILQTVDSFQTRNQFYGGQVGARTSLHAGRFSLDFTGKVGLGSTRQSITINGSTSTFLPGVVGPTVGAPPFFGPPFSPPIAVAPGGILALPSNIGHFTQSRFTVLPEVNVTVKARLIGDLSAFVGYSFLYWSNVVRPGDQVVRAINPLQAPSSPVGVFAPGAGPAQPTVPFRESDFWAQGINLGLEIRY